MTRIPLGAGPEFDRIRAVAAALGDSAGVLGDDCASIPDAEGTVVLSTDASIENVHFRRAWLGAEEIGWRAASAALSDLAAQGAVPVGLLAAVALPRETPEAESTAVMRGVGRAAAAVGAAVLGGDLSAAGEWMITVTVVGRAVHPVSRRGAAAGDGLWVTGALGAARAALDAWRAGREPAPGARAAFAHPEPRIAAGRWLGEHGARAMLDLSDGLAADAGHLAAASGCRAEVELASVPTAGDAVVAAIAAGIEPPLYAAVGGEDYELLAALPAGFGEPDQRRFEAATGLAITRVGRMARGSGTRFVLRGQPVALAGYDHFR